MAASVPPGILSLSLWNDAKDYLRAAETLIRESQIALPTYFLLSHGLELTLKAYLIARGVEERVLRKPNIRHDLQRLYDEAVALGLQIEDQRVPVLVQAISEFHKTFEFRYPGLNSDGDLILVRTLAQAKDVLEIVAVIWRRVESVAISARLEAAQGGQY